MELTLSQRDALSEVINIGYGRAASALSELTGHRVNLGVPTLSMHPIEDVGLILAREIEGAVVSVNQVFSGAISGTALLMVGEASAVMLSRLMASDDSLHGTLDGSGQEAITEVGNILLNACLSVFGDLLKVRVSFAVPRMQVADVGGVLRSITVESEELQHGLMINTHFRFRTSNVTGYLVVILGITSLERMLRELDNWEKRPSP